MKNYYQIILSVDGYVFETFTDKMKADKQLKTYIRPLDDYEIIKVNESDLTIQVIKMLNRNYSINEIEKTTKCKVLSIDEVNETIDIKYPNGECLVNYL